MATLSHILAWIIPWTEEPGGLKSIWSQRVGCDYAQTPQNKRLFSPSLFLHQKPSLIWQQVRETVKGMGRRDKGKQSIHTRQKCTCRQLPCLAFCSVLSAMELAPIPRARLEDGSARQLPSTLIHQGYKITTETHWKQSACLTPFITGKLKR